MLSRFCTHIYHVDILRLSLRILYHHFYIYIYIYIYNLIVTIIGKMIQTLVFLITESTMPLGYEVHGLYHHFGLEKYVIKKKFTI